MANCSCKPDSDGKVACLCGRCLKLTLGPPPDDKCLPRQLTVELWSGNRQSVVHASGSDWIELEDASNFALGGETLWAAVGSRGKGGAYTSRQKGTNRLEGVTGLANLARGTAVTSPPGPVDEFDGPGTITATGGWVLPKQVSLERGTVTVGINVAGDTTVNVTVTVQVPPGKDAKNKVIYWDSVTLSTPGGCNATCGCCCERLKLVISGFTGACGTNLNGTVYFDRSGCTYNLDTLDPGLPAGISGGSLQCTNCTWVLTLSCPNVTDYVTAFRASPNECPPMDGSWQLLAGGPCGESFDCAFQQGSGTLSCADEHYDCPSADANCGGCDCSVAEYEVVFSGVTPCQCFPVPGGHETAIFNINLNTSHVLIQDSSNPCFWVKTYVDALTVRGYEDEECTVEVGSFDYDLTIRLEREESGWHLMVMPTPGPNIFNGWSEVDSCKEGFAVDNEFASCDVEMVGRFGSATVTPLCDNE